MVALNGNFLAWELRIDCPLTPKPVRIQLDTSRGVGYSEATIGWTPVADYSTSASVARFLAVAGSVEGRFTLDISADQVTGEFVMSSPFAGTFPVTGVACAIVDSISLTAEAVDTRSPYHPVVREAAPLTGHTLYRPADGSQHPVVVWGNGGGSLSNEHALTFLCQVAAAGFAIVAPGDPTNRSGAVMNDSRPDVLRQAINWAASGTSPHLDSSAIAVMGHSMGGVQSWTAAAHPAVSSHACWNGSSGPASHLPAVVAAVTVPTMIVTGGPTDPATAPSLDDFSARSDRAPVIHIDNHLAGHAGIFHGTNDPAAVRAGATHAGQEIEVVASVLAVRWLNFTLRRDEESASYFLGDRNTISGLTGWRVIGSKNC